MNQLGNNYPNPLDHFRTYSYHFVLSVASTTEAFRAMIGNENGKSPFIEAVNNVKKIGDPITLGGQSAYLLIDTRRFSQFSIVDVEMSHIYGTGSRTNPTVPAGSSKMKVIDTTGLTFFTVLMDTMRNKIQSTRASAFFMLTVFFVGHSDNGDTETVSTCYIPMTLLSLGMEFNSSGSTYDIEFMELEGAPATSGSTQQINYLGDCKSVSTKGFSNDLEGMLNSLETQLNIQSLQFYQKYSDDAIQSSKKAGKPVPKFGKLVQYMITVPDEWKAFKLTSAARSKSVEQKFKTEAAAGKSKDEIKKQVTEANVYAQPSYSQISFSPTTTITDAIKVILECCEDLLKLASEDRRKSGNAFAYKTVVGITSDDTSYTIHFDIYPYALPKPPPTDRQKSVTKVGQSADRGLSGSANAIKNVIEYDYIFTGKNSHIMDLKIEYMPEAAAVALDTNLQLGSSRHAEIAAKGGQIENKVKSESTGAQKSNDFSPQIKSGDPIFLPMKSVDQQKNNSSQKNEELSAVRAEAVLTAKQEYTQTFAFLHFVSSIDMNMTIRGNPNLLRKYADRNERGGIAPHGRVIAAEALNSLVGKDQSTAEKNFNDVVKPGFRSSKSEYISEYTKKKINAAIAKSQGSDALINGADVATLPVFVKLNILAPNVDYAGNFIDEGALYTNNFFFNGPYQLLILTSKFSNAEFSQTLSMIPYDIDGSYSRSGDQASQTQTI